MAQSDGVGENKEQLITRTSMSFGWTLAFCIALDTTSKMTVCASWRDSSMEHTFGLPVSRHWTIPGGHAVLCPVPLCNWCYRYVLQLVM